MSRDRMASSHWKEHDTGGTAGISDLTGRLYTETTMTTIISPISDSDQKSKQEQDKTDNVSEPEPDEDPLKTQTTRNCHVN